MDRDLAITMIDVLDDIKVAVQTIANGGTPPSSLTSPDPNRSVMEIQEETEIPEETVTRSAKSTKTKTT